jgi:predicted transcriptional regulator
MTFDISKFAVSNSQQQSTVKKFEVSETNEISIDDIGVVTADALNVVALTTLMLLPSAFCIWYNTTIPFLYTMVTVMIVIGVMGLSRYDHGTRALMTRMKVTRGRIAWEQSKTSDKSTAKADIRFFRDGSNNQPTVTSVIKSSMLSIHQLSNLSVALVSSGKFNQDTVTKVAQISAQSYQNVASELMAQGLINFKGDSPKQGYKITPLGYQLFGQMAGGSTPLLADNNEN